MVFRESACKYILEHKELFVNFIDEDQEGSVEEYVEGMRRDGEWGGHLELQALSELLQCMVVVHKKNLEEYYVSPMSSKPKQTIFHIAYFQNEDFEHFLSIREREDESDNPAIDRLQ